MAFIESPPVFVNVVVRSTAPTRYLTNAVCKSFSSKDPSTKGNIAMVAKHKCLILILHHTRKSAGAEPGKHDVLGSSAFEAKMRTLIGLYRGNEPNEVKMRILKGNYLSPEDKQVVRYLSFVDQHFTLKNASIEVKPVTPSESKVEKAKKIISELLELHGETKSITELFKEAEKLGYQFGKSKFYSDIKEARSTTLSYGF